MKHTGRQEDLVVDDYGGLRCTQSPHGMRLLGRPLYQNSGNATNLFVWCETIITCVLWILARVLCGRWNLVEYAANVEHEYQLMTTQEETKYLPCPSK